MHTQPRTFNFRLAFHRATSHAATVASPSAAVVINMIQCITMNCVISFTLQSSPATENLHVARRRRQRLPIVNDGSTRVNKQQIVSNISEAIALHVRCSL